MFSTGRLAMAINPVTLTKHPLLFRIVRHSFKPTTHVPKFSAVKSYVKISDLRRSCWYSSTDLCKGLGRSAVGYNRFWIAGFSTGRGSGGNGGDGGSAFGSSGGSDGGGGGGKWSFLKWYLTLLEKYPVWTKAVTSALLTFVGDLICQLMIDQMPSLDLKRISLFTFLGLVLVGPTLHLWYLYLSKLVTLTGASGALLRLTIDQFLFAPIFIGVFLSTLVTLEGRPSQVMPKLKQEWFPSVLVNWQLWIPFQFLNFRFVPQQFQVLAANFVALAWNVILSYKAHKEVS